MATRPLTIIALLLTVTTSHCAHRTNPRPHTDLPSNGATRVAAGGSTVAGTYRACAMHCQTLVLRSDGTFEMTNTGDLFNNQHSSGRWSRDGDYLELTSDEEPCRDGMQETMAGRAGDIEIIVTDESGDPWIDGTVGASMPRLRITTQPDFNGRAVFPIESPSEITVDGLYTGRCVYVPSSRESDTFRIRVRPADMPPLKEERYLFTGDGIIAVSSWKLERVE